VDLEALPPEQLRLTACVEPRLRLGRQHHGTFFEGILGAGNPLLTCISRAHLEFAAVPGRAGSVEVLNVGANPVTLGETFVEPGHRQVARLPEDIAFLGRAAAGAEVEAFLRLRCELLLLLGRESVAEAAPGAELRPAPAAICEPGPGAAPARPGARPGVDSGPHPTAFAYIIQLFGGAMTEAVPVERRRLHGSMGDLVVGRAHQPEMHLECLGATAASFVSREHFRIRAEAGAAYFELRSPKPAWHARGDARTELWRGHPPVALEADDVLLLYTGAAEGSCDGPAGAGVVGWTFLGMRPAHPAV